MRITNASHLDHALTSDHLAFIVDRFGERSAFFLETTTIPDGLPPLACGLHGPTMGDEPVLDTEVVLKVRGDRAGTSRLCQRPTRLVRTMTVIGGPDGDEPCVLYTAFGGHAAPREPWDPSLDDAGRAASEAFWAQHALTDISSGVVSS
jgi:hypothetical protein